MSTEQYPKLYLYRRIVQAKLFIDMQYAAKIDIGHISDEAYFSKFHFIRLFKQVYGLTPHRYLSAVRIDKAMLLLRQGTPVSEVCMAVGFESNSSFSGLFKKRVGIAPSAYIVQQQLKQQQLAALPLQYVPGCFANQHGWKNNSNFEEVPS